MTINDAMRKYRLPNPTTPEDLECRWSKLLTFGDKVVIAGYFYNGKNKPCYSKEPSDCGRQARPSLKMTATQSPGRCSSKTQQSE